MTPDEMNSNDDYLWDRSGAPDPAVAQLEGALAPFRYQAPKNRKWVYTVFLAAAAAILAVFLAWPRGAATEWQHEGRPLRVGDIVRTAATTTIQANSTGTVTLQNGAELTITGQREFSLEQGTLHALIWAPPGEFIIGTPSGKAIDLGCEYTLRVDKSGEGLLTVDTGWVAFQADNQESFIPAGASCRTSGKRLGTPYRTDSAPGFRDALDSFDAGRHEALTQILAASRSADALTLWHLLSRTEGADRARVYSRLEEFVPLPSREAVLSGNADAMAEAWNALGYGDMGFWRTWKRPWLQ